MAPPFFNHQVSLLRTKGYGGGRQVSELSKLTPISFPYFEYRISNPPEAEIMKFSFPSTFPPPADSVFCGSLFSDTGHLKPIGP